MAADEHSTAQLQQAQADAAEAAAEAASRLQAAAQYTLEHKTPTMIRMPCLLVGERYDRLVGSR